MRWENGMKFVLKTKLAMAVSLSLSSLTGVAAENAAQEEEIEKIVVTGVRGSISRGIEAKRFSNSVVDVLSAERVGDFPDLNIAEALQRISGVTINRVEGEGQQVTVRGLAPEFTRVTLNGQTVTSGGGREVDLDIFASELFTEVALHKSPEAKITEGGLAATINMKTARPFDDDGFHIVASLKGAYNDLAEESNPKGTVVVSNTWDTFGVLLSASYSEQDLRADSAENNRWLLRDFSSVTDGKFGKLEYPGLPRSIIELRHKERLGLTAAFQYRPDDYLDINLDLAYASLEEFRSRFSIDGLTLVKDIVPVEVDTVVGDPLLISKATFNNVPSRTENVFDDIEDELFIANFELNYDLGNDWTLATKAGYSKAENTKDLFRVLYSFTGQFSFEEISLDGANIPIFSSTNSDFTNFDDYDFNQSRFIDVFVDDEEHSAQIDLTKALLGEYFSNISFGVRYSNRDNNTLELDERISNYEGLNPPSLSDVGIQNPYGYFENQSNPDIVRDWIIVPFDKFSKDSSIFPTGFVPKQDFPATFGVSEKTWAGYVQADFDDSDRLRGNIGLRVVNTDQVSTGFTIAGGKEIPLDVDQSYTEVLPSLNIVYDIQEDLLARFSVSRAMTRPSLEELAPSQQVSPTTLRASLGNPTLDPFVVNQADIGLEWYFENESMLSAILFYKDIESFITTISKQGKLDLPPGILNDSGDDIQNETFEILQPINGEGASVKGFELVYQQPFTFLPEPFNGFGISANYTYSDSEIEIDFDGQVKQEAFPGQSKSSYSLVSYYEKGDFSLRLAYSWRDSYLRSIRGGSRRNAYVDEYGQLDMSVKYDVTKKLTVSFDVLNLLEEETYTYAGNKARGNEYKETGRFLLLGAKYTF
jgi:TonB-dependent receptor